MNLVGAQEDESFLAIINDRILHDHLVSTRDRKDFVGKASQVCHRMIVLIHPLG